ncbi:MAG: hypothetical protein ACRERE_02635 [Candidatus Entotheonellia bacterium]
MALLHQLFSVEELKKLDPKEFEILKNALTHAIRTNRTVRDALRTEVRGVYDQLTQETPPPPTTQPPPATPRRRRSR